MAGIELNFVELKFENSNIEIHCVDYIDHNSFVMLKENNKDKIFKRQGERVYYWNRDFSENNIKLKDSYTININHVDNSSIFCRIIESFLIYKLAQYKDYQIWLDKYANTWNLLKVLNLYNSSDLGVFRTISFNCYFSSYNGNKTYGVVASTNLKTRFLKTKQELEKSGFDTRGLQEKDGIVFSNKKAIQRYLNSTQSNDEYTQYIEKNNNKKIEYTEIKKFLQWLTKNLLNQKIWGDLKITYCKTNTIPNENEVFLPLLITKPIRYYCDDATPKPEERLYYNDALKKYKPFNYENLKTSYKIIVICPENNLGTTEDFIEKVKRRLIEMFWLSNIDFEIITSKTLDVAGYQEAIYSRPFNEVDLALVVVLDKFKEFAEPQSPYLFSKAKYINQGIPTQEVRLETMLGQKNMLDFTINNISLNIFSKLGGIPWVVEKTDNTRQEYIIGITSTVNKANKKIFGVATVFEFNGKFYQSDCVPLSDFSSYQSKEEYANKLDKTITNLLNKIEITNNKLRFIFHLTKSPSNAFEIKALQNVLKNYKDIDVQFAFVKIGYYHNFRIYKDEGKNNVFAGQYIRISHNEALINFNEKDKTPVKITLHKDSTFRDLFFLSKQIYWFCHLSYRSFKPARKPVTTMYPWLITSLVEKMKNIPGWDNNILNTMGEKLWFI